MSKVDVAKFSEDWSSQWPDARPIGYELRSSEPKRWVRFHSLPASRRIPRDLADDKEVLRRHHTLLKELLGKQDDRLLVVIGASPDRATDLSDPVPLNDEVVELLPEASFWQTLPAEGDDAQLSLYVSSARLDDRYLDALLRMVVHDAVHFVIITNPELTWLYHPYDGGADVIAATTSARDQLKAAHADWLSDHPEGL